MTCDVPHILAIKSEKSELERVDKFLKEIFKKKNIQNRYFNKIFLCVSEAVMNAIEHGNRNICSRKIVIYVDYTQNYMNIRIMDEGEGFNYENITNPTNEDNIKKESGRGIFIINAFADSLEYNKKGNIVHFKINCG